jgi:GT2 family glycosyltransferase
MTQATPGRTPQGVGGASGPRVSVVLATYNRLPLLVRLLGDLAWQTLPAADFEVVVVDDGSAEPVARHVAALSLPYHLVLVSQENAGAAAARHQGVLRARGEILVLLDDDMQLPSGFLLRHLERHRPGVATAVFGRYRPDPNIASTPLFERWYAEKWQDWAAGYANGEKPRGNGLCTGNASMRREDYLEVGGFDSSLDRSEDAELGLKLEELGVQLVYSEEAYTVHCSDHTSLDTWLERAYRYGICDLRIARMHPRLPHADPWRFWYLHPSLARPLLWTALIAPGFSKTLAAGSMRAAVMIDALGLTRAALKICGAVFALEYFRGIRDECGGLRATQRSRDEYLQKVAAPPGRDPLFQPLPARDSNPSGRA